MSGFILAVIILFSAGCGIKSKPLPPLSITSQEPETVNQKEKKK